MEHKKLTRRELLQKTVTLGGAALAGGAGWGSGGCGSRKSLEAGKWRQISSPAQSGSISPRVTAQPDRSVVLSWLEPQEDRKAAMRLSRWREGRWSEPVAIASSLAFSRDQASAPGVTGLSPTTMMAYWSERVASEPQAANEIALYTAVSTDGGSHWMPPMLVNRAGAQPGEDNAYASAVGLDDQHTQFVWLDGREWEKAKRVQLMERVVGVDGKMSDARLLDPDTCTCCSTAIAKTPKGLLAAYRGHNKENIRDISLVRSAGEGWSQPRIPHPDHWHIEACPVNGPHLDVNGGRTALIWFTAPEDQPAVKVTFSNDDGAEFAGALRLDTGTAIGRAQIAVLSDGSAIGFWLENEAGGTRFVVRRVRDNGNMGAQVELAKGTNFGYPHIARTEGGVLAVWSERNPVSEIRVGVLQTS